MAVLPAGFALPPIPYLIGLAVGAVVVGGALWRLAPAVTDATVLGLVPWIAIGSVLHVWYVIEAAPAPIAPLLGVPAVYVTVFVAVGALWAAAAVRSPDDPSTAARGLALVGSVGVGSAVLVVLATGTPVAPGWPAVGLVVSLALAAVTWELLSRAVPAVASTGWAGSLVVFAHALDGVSTAVGVDVLGFGERTPLARAVMDVAASLPVADWMGVGWLFVLVKLAVAVAVVALLADLVDEDPRQGNLLLAVVAAVGLGPGLHNLLLYAVAG